jgi:hypothetical protein
MRYEVTYHDDKDELDLRCCEVVAALECSLWPHEPMTIDHIDVICVTSEHGLPEPVTKTRLQQVTEWVDRKASAEFDAIDNEIRRMWAEEAVR